MSAVAAFDVYRLYNTARLRAYASPYDINMYLAKRGRCSLCQWNCCRMCSIYHTQCMLIPIFSSLPLLGARISTPKDAYLH